MRRPKFNWYTNDSDTPAKGRWECRVNGVWIGFVAQNESSDPEHMFHNPTCYVCQHFDGDITSTDTLDLEIAKTQVEDHFTEWYNNIEYNET